MAHLYYLSATKPKAHSLFTQVLNSKSCEMQAYTRIQKIPSDACYLAMAGGLAAGN